MLLRKIIPVQLVFVLACMTAYGQIDFQTKETYDQYAIDLISSIRLEGQKYIQPLPKNHQGIKEFIEDEVDWHIDQVKSGAFINDEQLERYLKRIVDNLVQTNGIIRPFKVFIARDLNVNAHCTPLGSLIINNGLLAGLNSEEQLTYVLGHELAHWELEHIRQIIVNWVTSPDRKEALKEVRKLGSNSISLKGIAEIREWQYGEKKFGRELELEADSLALIMFMKLKYDTNEAFSALNVLDSGHLFKPYYGSKLFVVLNFEKHPFKTKWVTDDSKREFKIAPVSGMGPLSTHPNIPERIERLRTMASANQEYIKPIAINSQAYQKIKLEALFENIECGYQTEYYLDYALYYALRMKMIYPESSYVNGMISKILIKASELKEKGLFLIGNNIIETNKELYYVNSFLNNITGYEALDIAYYFMNQAENFDRENEEHYKILYDICSATNRFKMQEVIKSSYLAKFKSGRFRTKMY